MPGPVPTNQLKLRGSFRKDRHGSRVDASASAKLLTAPSGMSVASKAAFDELANDLQNVTTEADLPALVLLADALADYRGARDLVEAEGLVITGTRGPMAHPASRIARDAWQRCMTAMRLFGATPASRAALKISVPTSKPTADGKSRFFQRED